MNRNRYRVLEKLGEGGMGEVYVAEHLDLGRRVAIKVVHAEVASDPGMGELLKQEARLTCRLAGPYTCDVTDWGELDDGRPFFVMEYVEGESLAQLLDRVGCLSPEQAIRILRQVVRALAAVHARGLVHLDVKPANVLLGDWASRGDAIKLVDFGVAAAVACRGGDDWIMGTPPYMAPEWAGRGEYDQRSDIYSLGVMAHELLTGRLPGEEGARPLAGPLRRLIDRMVAIDPERRPQTMAEVEKALSRCTAAEPIPTGRRLGRTVAVAAALALVGWGLGVSPAIGSWMVSPAAAAVLP